MVLYRQSGAASERGTGRESRGAGEPATASGDEKVTPCVLPQCILFLRHAGISSRDCSATPAWNDSMAPEIQITFAYGL